jgi:YHS domain-containing protein
MIPKLLVALIILYILYRLVRMVRRGLPGGEVKPGGRGISPASGEELVEDPLCHTYIPISHACRASIDGKTLYFCSQKCLEQYRAERENGL